MSYPRDMIGYGRNPPDPRWPGGARIAVQFVVNYEEGGENNILHGDTASEAFLSEIVGAEPWPGQRHMNMELIYEYGSRAGFWRLWRLFTERDAAGHGLRRRHRARAQPRRGRGDARGRLGDRQPRPEMDRLQGLSAEAEERRTSPRRSASTRRSTGARPLGWYTGRTSVNTHHGWWWRRAAFSIRPTAYADDLPYWVAGPKGPHLIIPYTLDANDMRFATPQGFNSGDQFFAYLQGLLRRALRRGRRARPR